MSNIDTINEQNVVIGIEQIKQIIPYDEPFLFIDRVLRLEKNFIIAEKFINGEEDFFKGHFVDFKIMPGALIIEGVGQTATLLIRSNIPNYSQPQKFLHEKLLQPPISPTRKSPKDFLGWRHNEKDILAYKIKDIVFKAPVFPDSLIRYEVKLVMQDERFAIARGKVLCNENIVSECLMMLAIVSKQEFRGKYQKNDG